MRGKWQLAVFSCVALICSMIGVCVPMQASAETIPMTWKEFDKAYVVFEMDVGPTKLAMVEEFYQIIVEEYGFPMVISTNTGTALANKKFVDFMRKLEDHGGEITSHTHSGLVCNSSVPWEKIDKDFKTSAEAMEAAGFNVNGIMLAGGGGTEDTSVEYRTEIEKITSKYFYYSDRYGVSEQFYNQRDPVFYRGIPGWEYTKGLIDELIANKSWKGIFTHGYNEVTGLKYDEAYLRRVLDYLKSKEQEGVLEVVTYKYVYENLANWAKPIDFGDTKYTVDFYTPDGKTLLGSSVAIEGGRRHRLCMSSRTGMCSRAGATTSPRSPITGRSPLSWNIPAAGAATSPRR